MNANLSILLKVISALMLTFSLGMVTLYYFQNSESLVTVATIKEVKNEIESETDTEAMIIEKAQISEDTREAFPVSDNTSKEMIDRIDNYVGWITIDNTPIDYPVVRGNDNTFYLDHDFNGNSYIGGAIFMDRRNLGNNLDAHTIIYGHYMKNGSMFTTLNKYLDKDYLKAHPTVKIDYLFESVEYRIIDAYHVSANTFELPFSENLSHPKLLTLSTCNYILDNGRMVVHAIPIENGK